MTNTDGLDSGSDGLGGGVIGGSPTAPGPAVAAVGAGGVPSTGDRRKGGTRDAGMPAGVGDPRRPVRLFSCNLDATLIGTPGAAHHFNLAWRDCMDCDRPTLVYNSGRGLEDMLGIIADNGLPEPDYIISAVGTVVYDAAAAGVLEEYAETFSGGWDLAAIEAVVSGVPGVEKQGPENQNAYKSSWYLEDATRDSVDVIRENLKTQGLDVTVVYSGFQYLDIIPAKTNKGMALNWLCDRLGIGLDAVVVAGSSANDASCYFLPGVRGIVVENAKPELFEAIVSIDNAFRSDKVMSEGIVDGLVRYGVIDRRKRPPLTVPATDVEADPELGRLFTAKDRTGLGDEQAELLTTGYEKALEAIRRCITPMGFSAASLPDNEITGTDENYHSVWARDGCITVIGTVLLNDEDIRTTQRNTLATLLDNMSPNGQVPANVRLATGQPDYSGVGGICAIDSNLWVIIAVYAYSRYTGDLSLLRDYQGQLQRAMDWISAHDSNNDGLIEVPEASDWTDLFGRSYNVLYDEVLWFRANVCYGRLMEMLDDPKRAADYAAWAQFIQGRCLHTFWPTTSMSADQPQRSFADLQYSLGDAQYLLAEVTPFSFSWRCDTYGNILAFIMGLIDADRARKAFAYMWGCGVNEPWPVQNLYPVVQAGDPDWKDYYAVNLLNLPHHYHNGGIWPFIGGMWCRFIHRLGQHDVAVQELVKLAKLNKLGIREDWEFNEWAHGKTGRVLGKRYQAWSAASYIRACHELDVVSP
ncbi:MAG: HAD family hydrolase [Planctomycetota bacterium]